MMPRLSENSLDSQRIQLMKEKSGLMNAGDLIDNRSMSVGSQFDQMNKPEYEEELEQQFEDSKRHFQIFSTKDAQKDFCGNKI